MAIIKYPPHAARGGSSGLQAGDGRSLQQVPLESLLGKHLVIEEKLNGANTGMSFDAGGRLYLQSRGHFLAGGPRKAQFTLFKQWAATHAEALSMALGDRYVAYGEWLQKKHTVLLRRPSASLGESMSSTATEASFHSLPVQRLRSEDLHFLDTPSRAKLLDGVPSAGR